MATITTSKKSVIGRLIGNVILMQKDPILKTIKLMYQYYQYII